MPGFNLLTILKALPIVGPIAAAAPEFKAMFDEAVSLIKGDDDQATAKEAYQDLIAANAEGFARLDAKLAAAEKR